MARDPRWGRTEECYGEDPVLAAAMAKAGVLGFQGKDRSRVAGMLGMAVVAKHFAAQGAGEGGRNAAAASIGNNELEEIHLPSARAAVKAGVMSVMAAYNEIDGVLCHANRELLTYSLRGKMGFDGFVMSDGLALEHVATLAGDPAQGALVALGAGVDMSLWDSVFPKLVEALSGSNHSHTELDQAVARVLKVKFALGLFDNPYVDEERFQMTVGQPELRDASLQLARESLVLLENRNSVLPLAASVRSIAVIGPNADSIYCQLGDYTPPHRPESVTTALKGIRDRAPHGVKVEYEKGCGVLSKSRDEFAKAIALGKRSDVVVLVLGGSSERDFGVIFGPNGAAIPGTAGRNEMDCGEGVDVSNLELGGVQNDLAAELFKLGKPVICVLIQGRPYAIPHLAEHASALLCCWYPGPFGGQAIAEALFGDFSPAGRLPVSIPRSATQLPICYNRKDSGAQRYADAPGTPLYPFGYGLSYGKFEYKNLEAVGWFDMTARASGSHVNVSFEVVNTGSSRADEVVQAYVHRRDGTRVPRIRELVWFERASLEPGQSKAFRFEIDRNHLASKLTLFVGGDSGAARLVQDVDVPSSPLRP
jgi:beta-glucosidase